MEAAQRLEELRPQDAAMAARAPARPGACAAPLAREPEGGGVGGGGVAGGGVGWGGLWGDGGGRRELMS